MQDSIVLGVYGHYQTTKSHIKKYEHLGNLDLYTIHPEGNVLFDLYDHLELEELENDIEDDVTEA